MSDNTHQNGSSALSFKDDKVQLFPKREVDFSNHNDKVVFEAVKLNQPINRSGLCQLTNIPRSTVYDALNRLMLNKLVLKSKEQRTSRGRPSVFYEITFEG